MTVTVGIGRAALEGNMQSTDRPTEQAADECLYQAKALGRNRVVSTAAA